MTSLTNLQTFLYICQKIHENNFFPEPAELILPEDYPNQKSSTFNYIFMTMCRTDSLLDYVITTIGTLKTLNCFRTMKDTLSESNSTHGLDNLCPTVLSAVLSRRAGPYLFRPRPASKLAE